MNGTSVTTTAATAMSATQIAPFVQWALAGFPAPAPDNVAMIIAAGVIVAAHAAYKLLAARAARLAAETAKPAAS